MKRAITFLFFIAFTIGVCLTFTACDTEDGNETHAHEYSSILSFDSDYHWFAATCEHSDEIKGKESHDIGEDGKCKDCGFNTSKDEDEDGTEGGDKTEDESKDTSSLRFEYRETYSILTGIGTNNDKNLIIPSTYRGAPVTEIGERALVAAGFETLVIPDTVTKIGSEAFYSCESLKKIAIGTSVTEIGSRALWGCTDLEAITVGNGNTAFKVTDNVLYTKDGKTLVKYPSKKSSTSFTVPSGVEVIAETAFNSAKNLTSVTLPATIKSIGIAAFSWSDHIKAIDLPEGLTEISDGAFGYTNIESISFPRSLKLLGNDLFRYCLSLERVSFGGTKSEWAALTKAEGWILGEGVDVKVICSDGVFGETVENEDAKPGGGEEEVPGSGDASGDKDDPEGDSKPKVMTYSEFLTAEDGSKVVIEAYVQAKQGWWEKDGKGVITVYLQDNAGGYFAYNLACAEENAKKLTPGTKIRVTGDKVTWDGEVEIMNGTFEFCDENDTYIAPATDVTALMGTNELINHMNKFVTFKGLTVAPSTKKDDTAEYAFLYKWNGSGAQGDDLYFNLTDGTNIYSFCVESYLCGKDTDVYKAVEALKIGDKVHVEGFLYWYNGPQTHVTKISDGTKSEGVMTHEEYIASNIDDKVVIEAYVQANEGWWENNGQGVISVHLQDQDGGYYAYNLACTEEDAKKLTPGTKIRVSGTKAEFSGLIEIIFGTFEFCDENDRYIATAEDLSELFGKEELINHMNKFVSFKNLTVAPSIKKSDSTEHPFLYKWDGSGQRGDDIYFNLTDGTTTYEFTVERYLCDENTDVYKAVEALKIGDVVNVEGFLYWYCGPNARVTKVTAANPDVIISNVSYNIRYVDEDNMVTPVLNSDLEIGTNYTLELKFTITATENSDGNQYFDTVLTFTDINILNGTIKEAETGKQVEQKVIEAVAGSERKDIKLSFKVPSEKDVEKQITILVALTPIKVANSSQMLVDFSSDDAKILGDGISRSFSINRATLAKPVLTVDSGNKKISWAAVKNATYYMVFSDEGVTGIVINATDALELDLYNYPQLIGQNIYVQACSDSTDFIASEKSEPVTIW